MEDKTYCHHCNKVVYSENYDNIFFKSGNDKKAGSQMNLCIECLMDLIKYVSNQKKALER